MVKRGEKPDRWWLTLLVAVLPAVVAGYFSLSAIDRAAQASKQADQTQKELDSSYELIKKSMEVVQHESDAYRESLQHTTDLLVKLLEQKSKRNAEEGEVLKEAKTLSAKIAAPPVMERPHLPANLHDLFLVNPLKK